MAWMARTGIRKMMGKDVLPDSVRAGMHHPPLLFGVMMMELAQMRMSSVPHQLKVLASLATSRRVGCPF